MITDAWLGLVRDMLHGDAVTQVTHFAVGTGTTTETGNDIALESEVQPDGANRSGIDAKTKPSSKAVQFQMNIGAAQLDGVALTECGLLNAASGGDLANRITHAAINKTLDFELRYQTLVTGSDV